MKKKDALVRVEQACQQLAAGGMVVLVDDDSRENEGDLVVAAQHATPENINFMSREGCGLVCLAMPAEDFSRLKIPMMSDENRSPNKTAFGVGIEAAHGVTTGISAFDRAQTVRVAMDPTSGPEDIIMPGHVFPLRAKPLGVLERRGHTEGATDLSRLAGCGPGAVLCEVIREDGHMARLSDLQLFTQQHQLPLLSVEDIRVYRLMHESFVHAVAKSSLPLQSGQAAWTMEVFHSDIDGREHVVLTSPVGLGADQPLVRIHSECLTGDVFGSKRCDCGDQLAKSLDKIGAEGGMVIYLRQEGRGIGLVDKIKAYALQDQGFDTVEANHKLGYADDEREYATAVQILMHKGMKKMRLLTNNPRKIAALSAYGLSVTAVPLLSTVTPENRSYLRVKNERLGHQLQLETEEA